MIVSSLWLVHVINTLINGHNNDDIMDFLEGIIILDPSQLLEAIRIIWQNDLYGCDAGL